MGFGQQQPSFNPFASASPQPASRLIYSTDKKNAGDAESDQIQVQIDEAQRRQQTEDHDPEAKEKLNFSFAEGDELAGATSGNNDSFGKLEQPNTDYYHTSVVSQVKTKPTVVTNY